jgi:hypothetical protein
LRVDVLCDYGGPLFGDEVGGVGQDPPVVVAEMRFEDKWVSIIPSAITFTSHSRFSARFDPMWLSLSQMSAYKSSTFSPRSLEASGALSDHLLT